jgi:hypothetical protein
MYEERFLVSKDDLSLIKKHKNETLSYEKIYDIIVDQKKDSEKPKVVIKSWISFKEHGKRTQESLL